MLGGFKSYMGTKKKVPLKKSKKAPPPKGGPAFGRSGKNMESTCPKGPALGKSQSHGCNGLFQVPFSCEGKNFFGGSAAGGCVTSGGQDGYSCSPPRVRLLGMKSFHLGGVPTPRWVGFESFLLSGLGFRCFRVSGEPPPDLGTDEEIAQLFYRTI